MALNWKKQLAAVLFCGLLTLGIAAAESVSIQSVPEDFEVVWEIEDSRTEGTGLIEKLWNGDDRVGFDAENGMFLCAIAENGGWPELALRAEGAQGLQVCLVDDFLQDAPAEALRENAAYELLAWTDSAYCYYTISFTTLPLIVIDCESEIPLDPYVPCGFSLQEGSGAPIVSDARIHVHSGGELFKETRSSYRIELHRTNKKGKDKKNKLSLLGFAEDSDWLLTANCQDDTRIHSVLAWKIWTEITEGKGYNCLGSVPVELFVSNSYAGLYQLQQRIKPETQLKLRGADPENHVVLRTAHNEALSGRPSVYFYTADEQSGRLHCPVLQLRYAPEGMNADEAIAKGMDFPILELREEAGGLSDAEFIALMEKRFDIRELMVYYVFLQICQLGSGAVTNNLYLYTDLSDGETRYHPAPWDLDAAFTPHVNGEVITDRFVCATRLLELDALGAREILWSLWEPLRDRYTGGVFEEMTEELEYTVNDAGAFLRDCRVMGVAETQLDLSAMLAQCVEQLRAADAEMAARYPLQN